MKSWPNRTEMNKSVSGLLSLWVCATLLPLREYLEVCVGAVHPSEISSVNPAGQILQMHIHISTKSASHLWHIFRDHLFFLPHNILNINCACLWKSSPVWPEGEIMVWMQHPTPNTHPFLLPAESLLYQCLLGITKHYTLQLSVHTATQSDTTRAHLHPCSFHMMPAGPFIKRE